MFPRTPRNTGVYTRHPTFVTATSGVFTRLPAKTLKKRNACLHAVRQAVKKIIACIYGLRSEGVKVVVSLSKTLSNLCGLRWLLCLVNPADVGPVTRGLILNALGQYVKFGI